MDEESNLVAKALADTKQRLAGGDKASVGIPILSIPMIVIGHLYLSDCRVQPYLPIFLLVAGYFSILSFPLQVGMKYWWEDNTCCKAVKFWNSLIALFLFAWFIAGSVWVYRIEKVDYEDAKSVEYCNKTLYLFTWWLLTISWSLVAILFVLSCCLACCVACAGATE